MTSTTLDGKQLRRRIITTVGALNSKKDCMEYYNKNKSVDSSFGFNEVVV